jgi:hypothetical protein
MKGLTSAAPVMIQFADIGQQAVAQLQYQIAKQPVSQLQFVFGQQVVG